MIFIANIIVIKMDILEIKDTIKKFLEQETQQELNDTALNLVDKGMIDSFGMIKLITFIEEEFNMDVDLDSMGAESFNSIDNLAEQIKKWKANRETTENDENNSLNP
tara:strand:- start:4347 stop:4667 length:321 start_codon:yes stop_codon:yes gene_type:complete